MSTPLCSFIIYLDKDAHSFPAFLQDLRSFFNKFPLSYELVAVIEKGSQDYFRSLTDDKITLIQNPKVLRRSESLRQGLNKAQGAFLIIADPQLATPLGDLFKLLQHLMSEPLDICWGERYSKSQGAIFRPQTPRHQLEYLFNKILKEKNNLPEDSLCETVGLKKEAWKALGEKIPSQTGWYLSPTLRRAALGLDLKELEIFVHDSGVSSDSYSVWRERWTLLKKSLL